jgi:Tol biopolymer transport system component
MAIFSTLLEGGNETRVLSILDLKTMNKNVVFSGTGKYTDTQGLVWSPDGTKLMFSFGKQGKDAAIRFSNVDIYVLEISTGKITKITNDGINSDPKWSPNSSLITYIKHTAGDLDFKIIVSYDDGRCSQQITTNAYSADWSPDGRQLAFDYAGNIYTLDLTAVLGEDFQRPDYLCS